MFVELLIGLSILFLLIFWAHQKPKNLPPGEWGLPIIGYLPFLDLKLTKAFEKLQKKHGKIFSVKIGAKTFIVLCDYNLIKQAFQKPEINGRPFDYGFTVLKKTCHLGIIFSNGQTWSTNRRFALRTLRDFGMGKAPVLDEIILKESQSLINHLRKYVDKPIEVDWNVNVASLNVIFDLMASKHYDVEDKEMNEFAKYISDNLDDIEGPLSYLSFFPMIVPLVPKLIKDKWMNQAKVEERRDKIADLLRGIVEEHKKSLDKSNPRDYIDKYLIEYEQQQNNPEYSHWVDEDLLSNIYDFFMAGSETTSSTIRWFFLYMARYQDVQKRIQKEIDEIVPKGQLPSLYDKDNLPALEALTYEINRVITLVPNAVPHEVTKDTILENYVIPKGSIVIPNIETCHKDPQYWKYPDSFSLDNFLDNDGKVIRNKEGYLPFNLGRRQCPGESMAKMELFVFMGSILQNFHILEPQGQHVPLIPTENTNIINNVPKYKVILKNRK